MSIRKPRPGAVKIRNLGGYFSMRRLPVNLPEPRVSKGDCNCDCHLTTPHDNPHARDRCHCKLPSVKHVL